MTRSPPFFLTLFLLVASLPAWPPVQAAPPTRDQAGDYADSLLDENDPQRYMAGSRLKAVNASDGVPVTVERRLASFLRQGPTADPARAEQINQVATVLATSHAESVAIAEIADALAVVLEQQPLAVARRGSADALYMVARHTSLRPTTLALVADRAFGDPDRKVRIACMRTLIEAGPGEEMRARLNEVLMRQAALGDKEFAAPQGWDYDVRLDHNAIVQLLWNLHEPDVPEPVMALWVSKLTGGNLHDTAYRMLEKIVQSGPLPEPIYEQVLTAAERESRGVDPRRREELYRLLQRSRRGETAGAEPEMFDDLAYAATLASDVETGKRLTAGHRLKEFGNANPLGAQSLELIASVAQHEQDRELRQLALRVLGYSAPKQYVGVMHGYFDSGQYDHLVLRVFLAAYGREEWVRTYVNDADLHPKVRAAALYDYSRSGFEVPGSMISFMQDTARHDSEYDVRQAAGQSLRHLGAWVPLKTRLERQENQLMTLFAVWQAAVGVYLLGALVGVFFFVVRWSRVRQRFSVVGIFGWFAVVIALVPAVGFGALSLFRHNGPVPTSGEMFLVFLPTYVLVALFGYTTLQIIRAGMAERVPLTVATAGVVAVNRP